MAFRRIDNIKSIQAIQKSQEFVPVGNQITCPSCRAEFEITEVMEAQLSAQIRAEVDQEIAAKRQQVAERENALALLEKSLGEQKHQIEQEVQNLVRSERKKIAADARKQAEDEIRLQLDANDTELKRLRENLKTAERNELDLRKRERELKERAESLELEVARQIDLERAQIRDDADREVAAKLQLVAEREKLLADLEKTLGEQKENIEHEVLTLVSSERKKIAADARKQAEDDLRLQLDANDTELKRLRENLKNAERSELDLRKRERELQERAETLELNVARQINLERDQIRTKALTDADEQNRLKAAEKDKQIDDLLKKIDELKRKAEQGSQQLQGEVLELDLEATLRDAFPDDVHEPVAKGRNGGDVLQHVQTSIGRECGTILWESKRTKNWQPAWLAKLRDDQRAAGAECAILVSDVLPGDVKTFAQIDGVWVCSRNCVLPLTLALRAGMIEVAKARKTAEGRSENSVLVYNYLCSAEFQHHVSALAESFAEMLSDLDREQIAMQKLWKKRRKQLERAVLGTTSLYGDLQGLIGSALPEIRHLALFPEDVRSATLS
jgi:hypothetical protein